MSKPQTSNLKHVIISPMKPAAEQIRIRYLYRRKILRGEIQVSHQTAKKLVGPDTAYHLYGKHTVSEEGKGNPPSRKATAGRKLKGKGKGKSRNS
jgi:hypothetical protein